MKRASSQTGFTVIELLIAMVLLMIGTAGVLAMQESLKARGVAP